MKRNFSIDKHNITILENLVESQDTKLDNDVYFILSDGKLGALCYNSGGKFHAYFPDTDEIKPINDVTILEVSE